jgi:hypothetical protein
MSLLRFTSSGCIERLNNLFPTVAYCLLPVALFSSDHPVRPRQHIRWNRETDLLGRFQVNHELEFRRLLDRQFSRLRTF